MSRGPKPVPLDRLVVKRGWATDREAARLLIADGQITVDGLVVTNPSTRLRPDRPVERKKTERTWVSRGAYKLLGALEDLPMAIEGHTAADLGSSTGGFTEVLLENGAEHVFAIDVGRGLIHRRLEVDPRVTVMEGTNARTLQATPSPVTRIVGDLSFISLRLMLPSVARLLPDGGEALLMVKPQFEAAREDVLEGGTVTEETRAAAIEAVRDASVEHGFRVLGDAHSRLAGARSGNLEHFLWLQRPG